MLRFCFLLFAKYLWIVLPTKWTLTPKCQCPQIHSHSQNVEFQRGSMKSSKSDQKAARYTFMEMKWKKKLQQHPYNKHCNYGVLNLIWGIVRELFFFYFGCCMFAICVLFVDWFGFGARSFAFKYSIHDSLFSLNPVSNEKEREIEIQWKKHTRDQHKKKYIYLPTFGAIF